MAEKTTHLDELTEYPQLVIRELLKRPEVLELLANKPGAVYEDLENDDGSWKCFFDFDYVPGTLQEVGSYICVDTDVAEAPNDSVKSLKLYVEIIVSRDIMRVNRKILPGYIGNRRDNLAKYCDLALRGNRDFGIGRLSLMNANVFSCGNPDYTGRRLTYLVKDFNVNRSVLP